MSGLIVDRVMPGSIADELEIEPGDRLKSVNGHPLRDVIDYNYYSADDLLDLELEKGDGELWELEVEREEGEPLGLSFEAPLPARCGNNCVFCFVHQLPKGLRGPLYVKDEDYRLSFLYGNYVTLANIGRAELDRIKEQRLSPLYISVHATDPKLREELLGKSGILPILEVMKELAEARITMHTQVVLCPGWNDGEAFARTVEDLASMHPAVASLAVVPVGLTEHRKHLPPLTPLTREFAASFVEKWSGKARLLEERLGEPFLFLADEFYIKGEISFPPLESYGDLPQLENGVGMIPLFLSEAAQVLEEAEPVPGARVTVVTGESPYNYLAGFLAQLSTATGASVVAVAVKNRLFGPSVTVTGLICGRDIVSALQGVELGDLVLVPDVMLKEGEGVFLDDLTVDDLERELGKPVLVVEATPYGIYDALADMRE
uniref:PDZ domain-containing protein n=1 Tax=Geobacter sp. (strain M21) TaxID=443144 RepID=C6E4K9_GEOSM